MMSNGYLPTANPVDEMRTTAHLSTGASVLRKLSPLAQGPRRGLHTCFGLTQVLEEKRENGVLHTPGPALLLAITLK